MGIIINTRGRCIRRSVPVSLKLYLDLNDPQKPSPCPVAVFAFQSLDSYRDRMTQNMNRKHEKHTVPPPFEEVTNRLTMYVASLRRVYTAGGFLSNNGGTTWASPLRGDGFPRQCEHWLGMTARQRRADGTSYPKGICSAALHCRTPSPTKSHGVRATGRRTSRALASRRGLTRNGRLFDRIKVARRKPCHLLFIPPPPGRDRPPRPASVRPAAPSG